MLLILNYHRVGDPARTPYDSGTFSCTASEFEWQVRWLAARFPVVTLGDAAAIVHGETRPKRTSLLLTFDDGYCDNYDIAFPVLQRHGVSATFFLTTAFAGTGKLPWWDVIAAMVKHSRQPRIEIRYPEVIAFDLSGEAPEPAGPKRLAAIRDILKLYKLPATTDTHRFLREVESACETAPPDGEAERCFLTWDEARAMQTAGMCFGSHTHTHPILSKLPAGEQKMEVETSRAILERELQQPVTTLAYPVGRRDSFSAETGRDAQGSGIQDCILVLLRRERTRRGDAIRRATHGRGPGEPGGVPSAYRNCGTYRPESDLT